MVNRDKANNANKANEASKAKKLFLRYWPSVLASLAVLAFPVRAAYLDSRHWDEAWIASGFETDDLAGNIFKHHPLIRSRDCRYLAAMNSGFEAVWSKKAGIREPLSRGFDFKELKPAAFRLEHRLRPDKDVWFGLAGRGLFDRKEFESRNLYDNGAFAGAIVYEEKISRPEFRYWFTWPLIKKKLFFQPVFFHGRGRRSFELVKKDAAGIALWKLDEKAPFDFTGAGARFLGEAAGGWLWALGYTLPGCLKTSFHELVYESTASVSSSKAGLFSEVRLPAAVQIAVKTPLVDGRSFWAQAEWIYFSRTKINGRLTGEYGTGLFWDTQVFQQQVLGQSSLAYPSYRDTLGLNFGFEDRLSDHFRFLTAGRFQTHPADPRVIAPGLTLGAGFDAKTPFSLDLGMTVSRRDYFGDGLFYPKNARIDETTLKFFALFILRVK
ncbi:MAG: hypothetical protein HY747_06375 [Elusimicrobia bacterium]|nr:hypothetical protein [Elusimicrobiota bacterium]